MTLPLLSYRGAPRGHALDTLVVDVPRLLETKLLATATSGGGKSQLIRQLLEQTFGLVPHIVVDPEGEFPTLREKFDYLVAARDGGDVVASVKTARVLCRKIVENGASIVIDLSEISAGERREYVRVLLNELMSLPRSLWRDYIIVLDEAQMFAPEKGESVATDEVMSLSTRGRKRGFCLVAATLRISQFSKDASAPLLNRMIGLTGLDIDVKRAGEELGFDAAERRSLKTLDPGQFYVYGPAISKEVKLVRTANDLLTKSPPRGSHASESVAPPSKKMAALLAQSFAELPKEAEADANSLAALKAENAALRRAGSLAAVKPVDRPVVDQRAIDRAVADASRQHTKTVVQLRRALESAMKFFINVSTTNFDAAGVDKDELTKAVTAAIEKATSIMDRRLEARAAKIDELRGSAQRIADQMRAVLEEKEIAVDVSVAKNEPFTVSGRVERAPALTPPRAPRETAVVVKHDGISGVEQKLLDTIAGLEAMGVPEPDKVTVGALCGYANLRSKSVANAMGALRTGGLITYPTTDRIALTDAGRANATNSLDISSAEELHRLWFGLLGGVAEKILTPLVDAYPGGIDLQSLASAAGYENARSKSFANMKGRLKTLGLIDVEDGLLVATKLLFPEGLK